MELQDSRRHRARSHGGQGAHDSSDCLPDCHWRPARYVAWTCAFCTRQGLRGTSAWLTTIILGRDAGLGVAAIYYRWISLSPPKTFTRYWDFSLPSAEVRPTIISKYNTFLQLTLVGATTVAPLLETDLSATLDLLQLVPEITNGCITGKPYIRIALVSNCG